MSSAFCTHLLSHLCKTLPPPALPALRLQIAEDQPLQLDAVMPGGQKAGDVLVPRVLGLLGAPSPDLRALAVSTLNQLANVMPPALLDSMDRWEPGRGGPLGGHALKSLGGQWVMVVVKGGLQRGPSLMPESATMA